MSFIGLLCHICEFLCGTVCYFSMYVEYKVIRQLTFQISYLAFVCFVYWVYQFLFQFYSTFLWIRVVQLCYKKTRICSVCAFFIFEEILIIFIAALFFSHVLVVCFPAFAYLFRNAEIVREMLKYWEKYRDRSREKNVSPLVVHSPDDCHEASSPALLSPTRFPTWIPQDPSSWVFNAAFWGTLAGTQTCMGCWRCWKWLNPLNIHTGLIWLVLVLVQSSSNFLTSFPASSNHYSEFKSTFFFCFVNFLMPGKTLYLSFCVLRISKRWPSILTFLLQISGFHSFMVE